MISTKNRISCLIVFVCAFWICAAGQGYSQNGHDSELARHDFRYPSQYVNVDGVKMHYVEAGAGDPILLIHGNPTWSYLWRNIIPHLQDKGRVIALDLVGFGKSEKPDIEYLLADHTKYLNGFIEALKLENLVLVIQDWGSFLGFQYAMNHPDNVKGIVFMEALLPSHRHSRPAIPEKWQARAAKIRKLFGEIGAPDTGRDLLVRDNAFIEQLMPLLISRELSEDEWNAYREPFADAEARKPIHVFRSEVGSGATRHIFGQYSDWLQKSPMPKLGLYFNPGFIGNNLQRDWAKENLPNITIVDGGEGLHYVQEDRPEIIGKAIGTWIEQKIN